MVSHYQACSLINIICVGIECYQLPQKPFMYYLPLCLEET